ncbi:MAG: ferredoxin [Actinomycetota bacterium]
MRVRVDSSKCQGHNRCYALAPELFDVDDLGNAFELNDGVVPAGLEDKARLAAANCPECAIIIEGCTPPDLRLRTGRRLADRLRPRRPGVQPEHPRHLGGPEGRRLSDCPHRALRRGVAAAHP